MSSLLVENGVFEKCIMEDSVVHWDERGMRNDHIRKQMCDPAAEGQVWFK